MMYMFPSFKFTTKMLFHYMTMQSFLFPIYINIFIFMFWFTSWFPSEMSKLFKMNFCKTRTRTIFYITSFNSILANIKFLFTIQAIEILTCFLSRTFTWQMPYKFNLAIMTTESSSVYGINKFYGALFTVLHGYNYTPKGML